jgi:hypothetical protein
MAAPAASIFRVEEMETTVSSKTLVTFYQTTWHHIVEGSNLKKCVLFFSHLDMFHFSVNQFGYKKRSACWNE